MAEFHEDEISKLAKLCRIACTDDEKKALHSQIHRILMYIEELTQVDTDGVAPCATALTSLNNVMRDDKVEDLLPTDLFFSNAPARVGSLVRVPPVIKPSNPS